MALIRQWADTFEFTGSGNGFASVEMFPSPARGRISFVVVRAEGGATSMTSLWIVRNVDESLVTGEPDASFVVLEGSGLALSASASASSGRSPVDCPAPFRNGLGGIVEVVASGAWSLFVTVVVDDLDGTGIS